MKRVNTVLGAMDSTDMQYHGIRSSSSGVFFLLAAIQHLSGCRVTAAPLSAGNVYGRYVVLGWSIRRRNGLRRKNGRWI